MPTPDHPIPPSVPSLFHSISNEEACSSYLAELHLELPLAASQFGLVLSTALEYKKDPTKLHTVKPISAHSSGLKEPHYRSKPLPVHIQSYETHKQGQGHADDVQKGEAPIAVENDGAQTEIVTSTKVDLTISGDALTFYARCEPLLMQAATSGSATDNGLSKTTGSSHEAYNATSESFTKALEQSQGQPGSVIHGHYQNVLSAITNVLEYQLSERVRLGQSVETQDEFYCVNDIWREALIKLGNNNCLKTSTRAVKFVISEDTLLQGEPTLLSRCRRLENEHGLILDSMRESDVNKMLDVNKVKYPEEYGKKIIRLSKCFRDKDGEMVAWAGTHGDFSIAALHVLPEYRKLSLGRIVLNSLALTHVQLARGMLTSLGGKDSSSIPTSSLYAHADCLDDNIPTMAFMEHAGWHRVGTFIWFDLLYKSQSEKKD
ncbi:hypothetical protein BX616_008980 [Lobosporangium transversale]|uniref:N-acetyltransferase domain-containing protein n=1 Tax=Lobosporangium transversale TaxID=64571 RepID=A0A1Y2G7W1_9FUNG|nr:hypothetical protein BCR41DRAFT_401493 [Lobosporangium transversale]KAF9914098.1 hypothetical protein BX616_008980 [Lobosporangium transversale]ORZ01852.1 hypothetical protein BCR41DRAFT_401493 [Lobosporangium transversale]|eukprot:XP_021876149.1 hypothetical protein BCR41DRAFT_401493 [Lobosporangium transversale]